MGMPPTPPKLGSACLVGPSVRTAAGGFDGSLESGCWISPQGRTIELYLSEKRAAFFKCETLSQLGRFLLLRTVSGWSGYILDRFG